MIRGKAKNKTGTHGGVTDGKVEHIDCESCPAFTDGFVSKISPHRLAGLKSQRRIIVFRKRQVIFYEGTPCTAFYCLRSGLVKLSKTEASGSRRMIVRLIKPGDVLGYRSLMAGEPYTATAEAVIDSTICMIPQNFFLDTIKEEPAASAWMLKKLSVDLRQAEDMERDLVLKGAPQRLAHFLVILIDAQGVAGGAARRLHMNLTREEVAEVIGVTTETVVRTLSEFQEKGVIALDGHDIVIKNYPSLQKLSGEG